VVYAGRRRAAIFVAVLVLVNGLQFVIDTKLNPVIAMAFMACGVALCWVLGEFVGARRAYQLEVDQVASAGNRT
jgi:hypothetical protein